MTLNPRQFAVITQHGADRTVRRKSFPDWDSAVAHAKANNPDTDSSMIPSLDEPYASHPDAESSEYWHGNRYAMITQKGNRKLR